jgi:hypothetical protein
LDDNPFHRISQNQNKLPVQSLFWLLHLSPASRTWDACRVFARKNLFCCFFREEDEEDEEDLPILLFLCYKTPIKSSSDSLKSSSRSSSWIHV